MSERVTWRRSALADLTRIVLHIHEANPIAARRVGQELILAGDGLALFPRRGCPGRIDGTRELATVAPYIIVYEIDEDGRVSILRLWHGAQDRESP